MEASTSHKIYVIDMSKLPIGWDINNFQQRWKQHTMVGYGALEFIVYPKKGIVTTDNNNNLK